MIEILDDSKQLLTFEKTPQKIISLTPSFTETLFELGLEERILGITHLCTKPFHFSSTKTIVTNIKGLNFERIKGLTPDIIFIHCDDFTEDVVNQLKSVCKVYIAQTANFNDVLKNITDFGKLFNKNTDADKWNQKLMYAKKDFDEFMNNVPEKRTAYLLYKEPFLSVNKHTFISEMLSLNHFKNIYAEKKEKYPEIEIRKIRLQGDPEIMLLSSSLYSFTEEDVFEIGRNTHHAKTIFIDGEMFSWFGTRLFKAFEYFKTLQLRIEEK